MPEHQSHPRQVISNVGILDLRHATEESVAQIKRIDNVGMLLYAPETAALVTRLSISNLGTSIEVPADAQVLSGQVVFTRDSLKEQARPLNLAVAGQLIINPDITVEDVATGLGSLVVAGQVFCPEHLAGAIQAKLRNFSGQWQVYAGSMRLTIGTLTLEPGYLEGLEDAAGLAVIGELRLPEVVPDDLLSRKIKSITVIGKLLCHEENAATLRRCLDDKTGTAEVEVIPAGFALVDHPLVVDAAVLKALPGRELYCTDKVRIEPEVEASALGQALAGLQVRGLLLGPAALKETIASRCDLTSTQAVFYAGELWLVEGEELLGAPRFEYLEGKATLVVLGRLTLAPEVEPRVLAARLDRVHNLGQIHCTPEQMGALQARLGLKQGRLVDATRKPEPPAEEEGVIRVGNAGHLAL